MSKTIVVKLVTRPTIMGKRTRRKVNLKKIYPDGTDFILRWLPEGAKNYSYKIWRREPAGCGDRPRPVPTGSCCSGN
jgi:hypothetical protein